MTTKKALNRELTRTIQGAPSIPKRQQLTWEEEMTVRMAHGVSEGPDAALAFRGQLHTELRARLAGLEAELLASMHGRGPLAAVEEVEEQVPTVAVDEQKRSLIMERLAAVAAAKKS